MANKSEKFINKFLHKIFLILRNPVNQIKTYHERLLEQRVWVSDDNPAGVNPYQALFLWTLDMLRIGLIVSIPVTYFMQQPWYKIFINIIPLGCMFEVFKMTVSEIKNG